MSGSDEAKFDECSEAELETYYSLGEKRETLCCYSVDECEWCFFTIFPVYTLLKLV